jgi:hypothetical protein
MRCEAIFGGGGSWLMVDGMVGSWFIMGRGDRTNRILIFVDQNGWRLASACMVGVVSVCLASVRSSFI